MNLGGCLPRKQPHSISELEGKGFSGTKRILDGLGSMDFNPLLYQFKTWTSALWNMAWLPSIAGFCAEQFGN